MHAKDTNKIASFLKKNKANLFDNIAVKPTATTKCHLQYTL